MLEHIVKFYPAFDKRSLDPKKNYGIHGVELLMLVKGSQGCIQFKVMTNWMLPHVEKELDSQCHDHILCHPMAADLGYHSYIAKYEGQTIVTDSCEWLEGKPCYYDGSGLNAEPILQLLIAEGSDAVWLKLEDVYQSRFES